MDSCDYPFRRPRTNTRIEVVNVAATAVEMLGPNPMRKGFVVSMTNATDIVTIGPNSGVTFGKGPLNLSAYTTGLSPWILIFTDDDIGDAICGEWWVIAKTGNFTLHVMEIIYMADEIKPAF